MTSFPDWLLLLLLMAFTTGPFLIILGAWLSRRRLGLPRRGRLLAIATWADDVGKHEAEVKTATFGDLILFVTLYVIGVTLFVTWYLGKKQTEAEAAKQENARLEQTQHAEDTQIRTNAALIADKLKTRTGAPKLISPSADERIIGKHLDFRWEYGNHSRSAKYEIQLIRVPDDDAVPVPEEQDPPIGEECTFQATNSPEQRSRFFAPEGAYVWRVGFGELLGTAKSFGGHVESASKTDFDVSKQSEPNWSSCEHGRPNFRIREWSAFRNFSFYHSRLNRMYATHKVLVGVNAEFGGSDDGPGPFELDLVRGIASCLVISKDDARNIHVGYDKRQCVSAIHALIGGQTIGGVPPVDDPKRVFALEAKFERIRGVDWKDKLQSKAIDLYVGTLTKAAAREEGADDDQTSQWHHAGMKFSTGYLQYSSQLLVDSTDACANIKCLADQLARVGALEGSTNLTLAKTLTQTSGLGTLKVVAFQSPADIENAYEKGEIRAVLIDNVLKPEMGLEHARILTDLSSQSGWKQYLRSYIGDEREQFAIAVGLDLGSSKDDHHQSLWEGLFSTLESSAHASEKREQDTAFFVEQVNCALGSDVIRNLMASSYDRYSLKSFGVFLLDSAPIECPNSGDAGINPRSVR